MPLAITEDHRSLADTAAEFLARHGSLGAARTLLDVADETLPPFWDALTALGWTGLHLPEEHGGSGYGLFELAVVVEQLGRALTPGPFVPSAVVSALVATAGDPTLQAELLPGFAAGTTFGAVSLDTAVTVTDGAASGTVIALGGGLATWLAVPAGDDVALVDLGGTGADVQVPTNLDPTRRAARVTLDGAPVRLVTGAGQTLVDLTRLVLAAEAVGIAGECTHQAAEYAKVREQFGRVIGTFQGVKHHCANMLVATEMATAAVWDAARAAEAGDEQLSLTAAMAAALAIPAADLTAQLNIQVHGGIGFTYEHDAHLYLRRATAVETLLDADAAAAQVTDLYRRGVRRVRSVDLPPEAEPIRDEVRAFAAEVTDLDETATRARLIETGYVMPHWPRPWGRAAGAVEQLVIEQEFAAAGVKRPSYSITGWVILTLIQHGTDDQVTRWVPPALAQDVIWCQLFSEPDAGSDAAGVKTRATRVDGGWLVNGQKVWTSGAHVAGMGFATVRTNPDAPKHQGITTMVIDMHAQGVEVRPIKMPTGDSEFNEVFFDDVFVPDDDVVGPIDGGWTVARATLGNESVSIGGGQGGMALPGDLFLPGFDAHPERLSGGAARLGRYIANDQATTVLNLRSAHRAVAGGAPGPEGNVTKLVLSENMTEAAAMLVELTGPEAAFLDGPGVMSGTLALMHRAMSIAGGTSEIKRNQIGERILGLPRDPLIN
jgi:alkylation response protein AidB-like acyl-CoA dehydrogenase